VADVVDLHGLGVAMLRDSLRSGEPIEIRACGLSMWPRLDDGAVVRVEPCLGDGLRSGDVVLFERGGRLLLHRVLRVARSRVLTKGDACVDPDGWVPRHQVLGRLHRRRGDRTLARLAPHTGPALGFASAVVRHARGFASKF
jgi:hypothetical protein